MTHTPTKFLRAIDAASYLGLSRSTLAKMRMTGEGPPYSKAGRRIVVYDQQRLDDWLAIRLHRSTSDQRISTQS